MPPQLTGPDIEKLEKVSLSIRSRLPQSAADLVSIAEQDRRLVLTWKEAPSPFAIGVCQMAWESVGGGVGQVDHTVLMPDEKKPSLQLILDNSAEVVAQIAYGIVLEVMKAGEAKHGNTWLNRSDDLDIGHARVHLADHSKGDTSEDHLEHAMTRLAITLARRVGRKGSKVKGGGS